MPSSFTTRVDFRDVDAAYAAVAKANKRFPRGKRNPLLATMGWYLQQLRTRWLSKRPAVSRSGSYMGERWPGFNEAYVSHVRADGTIVDAFGATPRVKTGTVTKARRGLATQRKASDLTAAQKAAGYGAVKLGQKFTTPNVLGRLKPDGSRLKATDKQLGDATGGLIEGFVTTFPTTSPNGKTVTQSSNKPYGGVQAKKRRFHWTKRIGALVKPEAMKYLKAYVVAEWRKRDRSSV